MAEKEEAKSATERALSNGENMESSSDGNLEATSGDGEHVLLSNESGKSNIEMFAEKIEKRRQERIPVTFKIRKVFLKTCNDLAKEEGHKSKMSREGLHRLIEDYREKVRSSPNTFNSTIAELFGFWNTERHILKLLEAGCEQVENIDGDWFFYQDFNFYNTKIAPRVQLFGNSTLAAIGWLLLFYFSSAILFCPIMNDDAVCENRDDTYEGWLTAVYFGSVTMSTVGYGDVSLSGGAEWRTFIGIIYMLVAMAMAFTVFSTAAGAAVDLFQIGQSSQFGFLLRPVLREYGKSEDGPLYQKIRRITIERVFDLTVWFTTLNLIGVFVARFFIRASDIEGQDWSWMTTLYWAVQTTTTIGYGDLDMPFNLRWFQVFYTTLGTAFVGAVFGAAASLHSDITDLRRFFAWKRRKVSKRLIEDMQGPDADSKVDQFEFLVGSLVMLNKLDKKDITQIMDKFRELAGGRGFIMYDDGEADTDDIDNDDDQFDIGQ